MFRICLEASMSKRAQNIKCFYLKNMINSSVALGRTTRVIRNLRARGKGSHHYKSLLTFPTQLCLFWGNGSKVLCISPGLWAVLSIYLSILDWILSYCFVKKLKSKCNQNIFISFCGPVRPHPSHLPKSGPEWPAKCVSDRENISL